MAVYQLARYVFCLRTKITGVATLRGAVNTVLLVRPALAADGALGRVGGDPLVA